MQAEVNIGLLGHVDHGKTTLTFALTGKWADTHSEEIKRGISIRLGYANASIYYCPSCDEFLLKEKCEKCNGNAVFKRKISFLDAPGHETLMTTVIAASSIIDGALFLIAANEECPQPQTTEHLMVLNSLGIKNIVVVQTKIDLVSREKAIENYNQIKKFLKGSVAENAPIIPVAAHYGLNIGELLRAIEENIKTPKKDSNAPLRFYVSRSFDVNKPGTPIEKMQGGVIGGSISQGTLKVGEKIEIKPGIPKKEGSPCSPIICEVKALREENEELKEAMPGGLIAISTSLDPYFTKADSLVGSIISRPGELPDAVDVIKIKYDLLQRTDIENPPLRVGELLAVNAYTATSVGVVSELGKGIATLKLKRPIVLEKNTKIALSRRIGQRWRLAALGIAVG
jgi:translation initiation factor 2 subunit 3